MAQVDTQFAALASESAAAQETAGVRTWLLVLAALVFLLVGVGGATRLTGSGLSITEWLPIAGVLPPLSQADWLELFAKYQQIPQYHHVNPGMSLEAFKAIFWWEWVHRCLGRLVLAVFLLPLIYFLVKRQIPRALMGRLAFILALGALQGLIGWYMVSSGLAERTEVSPYRLALHLALAILIFGALLWAALAVDDTRQQPTTRRPAHMAGAAAIAVLTFGQIVLGAFVAGLRAGASYNTWPLIDGRLVPDGLGAITPWYLNLFENALTVQFTHRLLAYGLVLATLWQAWSVRADAEDRPTRRSAATLAGAVLAQAVLGIATLLAHVPLALALLHQAGAVVVFGLVLWHLHGVLHPRRKAAPAR